jgi:hypothetical protein
VSVKSSIGAGVLVSARAVAPFSATTKVTVAGCHRVASVKPLTGGIAWRAPNWTVEVPAAGQVVSGVTKGPGAPAADALTESCHGEIGAREGERCGQ